MDPSAKAAFFVSLSSIAQVLTILAIGALATHNGLLTPDARSLLARLTLKLCFPCLILSVADDYDWPDLVR
jgi:predicted permease